LLFFLSLSGVICACADCLPPDSVGQSATTSPYQFNRVIRGKVGRRRCDHCTTTMAEFNVDVTRLPDDVREKLAELELELSEGKYSKFFRLRRRLLRSSRPGVALLGWSPPPHQVFANPSTDRSDSFQSPARFSVKRFFYFPHNKCLF